MQPWASCRLPSCVRIIHDAQPRGRADSHRQAGACGSPQTLGVMKSSKGRSATFFVSALFFVLCSLLLFLMDVAPPKETRVIEGAVIKLTPIKRRGTLTGFRFCVGDPIMTFTYSDPDPNVASAWATIQRSKAVRVQYKVHQGRNPSLWGLEVDDRSIASTAELEAARVMRFALLLLGAFISGAVVIVTSRAWLRSRRLQRDVQPFLQADA